MSGLPMYVSFQTKMQYICKHDIFASTRGKLVAVASIYDMPLPIEANRFLQTYQSSLSGTCEFVSVVDYVAARAEYDELHKIDFAQNQFLQNVGQKGILHDCLDVIKPFESIMRKYPEVLLPNKKENPFRAVRLFKEGKNSFSMAVELDYAVNGTLSTNLPDFLDTVDIRVVLEASKTSKFEILLTTTGTKWILTPDGRQYSVPEIVLMEIAVFATCQKNIFSEKLAYYQEMLGKLRCLLWKNFPFDRKERFFISEEWIVRLWHSIHEIFKDNEKNNNYLRFHGSDRKMAYFARLFPEFVLFLHNQNQCVLFPIKCCTFCPEEKRVMPERPTFEEEGMEMLMEYEKASEEQKREEMKATAARNKRSKKKDARTLEVPEVPEATESSNSASTSQKPNTGSVRAPKTAESTSTCKKCFRTREYCEKAKERLKESQSVVKRLEKKQKETDKQMEKMDAKIQELLDNQEQMEQLKKENEELKAENAKLKAEVEEKMKQAGSDASRTDEPLMSQEERVAMLHDLTEKEYELHGSNIYHKTELKVQNLINWKPSIQEMAYAELIQLKSQYETYQKAVAATKKLLGCERIIRSRILPLPDFPKLSEHFERQYQEMIDQENECLICFNHLDKQDLENIFTCSVCKSSTHLKCVEEWFQTSRTCPHCRDKWN